MDEETPNNFSDSWQDVESIFCFNGPGVRRTIASFGKSRARIRLNFVGVERKLESFWFLSRGRQSGGKGEDSRSPETWQIAPLKYGIYVHIASCVFECHLVAARTVLIFRETADGNPWVVWWPP